MTRIKICGFTRADDINYAIELGVSYLGFIFHEASPRYITPEKVAQFKKDLNIQIPLVGVFVNKNPAEMLNTAQKANIDIIQAHGNETIEDLAQLNQFEVWKVHRLVEESDLNSLKVFKQYLALIDSPSREWGGSGILSNWDLAKKAAELTPLILAGGIGPKNIQEAIQNVKPYGVDISSGVESKPGVKDHNKLKALFEQAKEL